MNFFDDDGGPTDKLFVDQRVELLQDTSRWHSFEDILLRLHQEGIYVHPDQLAEFFLRHGLPVDLRYVPERLKQKATKINDNYLGDMARLEDLHEIPWYSSSL